MSHGMGVKKVPKSVTYCLKCDVISEGPFNEILPDSSPSTDSDPVLGVAVNSDGSKMRFSEENQVQ